jgi:3-oxosteroid 1-dehydrogenase
MAAQEETYDFIIVGSGGGSAPAALVMKEAGKRVLIIEKEPHIGGTSAYSGGIIWIPNNHIINDAGDGDSHARSREYLDNVIGEVGPASTPAKRDAFIREGAQMIEFLEGKGMKFLHAHWPDYYDTTPGGLASGRSLGAPLFDVNELGKEWAPKLAAHQVTSLIPISSHESVDMFTATKTLKGKILMTRIAWRMALNKFAGKKLRGAGNALQGRLYQIVLREKIPIWTESPVKDFIVENDRVVGVVCEHEGKTVRVRAELGVLLNAGGFARNKAMREQYQRQPMGTDWTQVSPGHTGEMIQAAEKIGAAIDLMDENFYLACSFYPDGSFGGMHSPNDIGKPHCIVVDKNAQRFANEATNYMEFGQKTFEAGAIPAWAIFDAQHRKYYPWGLFAPGITPQSAIDSGYLKKASTLEDLARQCDLDPAALKATVDRFNGFCKTGVDEDFHRGESEYNKYYGDPTVKPNACLAPINKGPYYAVQIWPGDVGTAGGVLCDENSRVLRKDGTPIQGLYATGITTATVVGRSYPGAGASVGPSMTFGYIAAKHAARLNA